MLSSVTNNFLRKSALIINNEVLSHIQYIHVYSVYGFYSTMLYAIVSFDATYETDFLPLKWIASDMTVHDIPQIVESRQIVEFYWPPWKNPLSVSKAKKDCQDAEVGWPRYRGRILSTASMRTAS
jgi:hypothetical protein